jgi:hypothetical protein
MCKCNIEARSRNYRCREKAINVMYYEGCPESKFRWAIKKKYMYILQTMYVVI